MTSLLTNVAAMTALQTLQATNKSMESTQNRISTGLRVSQASDNAAYWSIATTMRSDNKAMSAVMDALGIGSATVDTGYTAMESIKDTMDEIKKKLTTATGENVDKSKVQGEIKALQNTITSIAKSASFSGENFLSVDKASIRSVIASFSRSATGTITLGSIEINTAKTALFNSNSSEYGLLEAGKALATPNTVFTNVLNSNKALDLTSTAPTVNSATATVKASTVIANAFGSTATTFKDEAIRFTATVKDNGVTTTKTITIDKSVINAALGVSDGKISTNAEYATVFNLALKNAGINDYTMDTTDGKTVNGKASGFNVGDEIRFTAVKSVDNGNFMDVASFDITSATANDVETYLKDLEKVISKVVSGAASLGASKNQIDMQTTFTSKLMDAIDRGIGTLVDADMTEESTKLKALQTQQQLGVQALSIANSSSQSIMQLFQG